MADIDKKVVEKLASLCKIACSEEEKDSLLKDLQKILAYIDQLNEIPTESVQPCNYVTEMVTSTPQREDTPENTLSTKDFLSNSPKHTGGMIRVPNVLKQ